MSFVRVFVAATFAILYALAGCLAGRKDKSGALVAFATAVLIVYLCAT